MFYCVSSFLCTCASFDIQLADFLRMFLASDFILLLIRQPELGELHMLLGGKNSRSVMEVFSSLAMV